MLYRHAIPQNDNASCRIFLYPPAQRQRATRPCDLRDTNIKSYSTAFPTLTLTRGGGATRAHDTMRHDVGDDDDDINAVDPRDRCERQDLAIPVCEIGGRSSGREGKASACTTGRDMV